MAQGLQRTSSIMPGCMLQLAVATFAPKQGQRACICCEDKYKKAGCTSLWTEDCAGHLKECQ